MKNTTEEIFYGSIKEAQEYLGETVSLNFDYIEKGTIWINSKTAINQLEDCSYETKKVWGKPTFIYEIVSQCENNFCTIHRITKDDYAAWIELHLYWIRIPEWTKEIELDLTPTKLLF